MKKCTTADEQSETASVGQSQRLSRVLQGATVAPGTLNFFYLTLTKVVWDRTCIDALDFLDVLDTNKHSPKEMGDV